MEYVKFKNGEEPLPIGKIIGVGRNYAAHAKELGNEVPDEFPLIFMKNVSGLLHSGGEIIHPTYSTELHHEVELVLVIGKDIKDADNESAEDAIYGYGVGFDMTLRDLQFSLKKKGEPWTLAKCFDGAAVISDFITKNEYKLKGNEAISLKVNGETRQNSTLDKMLFDSISIIKFLSSKMKLEKGDLIFTGTPEGVGKVVKGDLLEGEIENIASLKATIG